MKSINDKLHVVINGTPILEFDRTKPIPGIQRRYLDNMDQRMDAGIQVDAVFIAHPNPMQRAQFVANSLVNSLFMENYIQARALCTYLAKRIPELQQIKALGNIKEEMSLELVFDRNYEKAKQEQVVQFRDFPERT